MTDVTGFGLAGHLLEVCRGSGLSAELDAGALPLIPAAERFARDGIATGASARNWAGYGRQVEIAGTLPAHLRTLLTDPQTSGGLLVSCAAEVVAEVCEVFHDEGFDDVAEIGRLVEGAPAIDVR